MLVVDLSSKSDSHYRWPLAVADNFWPKHLYFYAIFDKMITNSTLQIRVLKDKRATGRRTCSVKGSIAGFVEELLLYYVFDYMVSKVLNFGHR